jgi:predicted MFS family arabinose efflux permease
MPLPNSMALAMAEPGRSGRRLGQLQGAAAAGTGIGFLAALLLTVYCGVPMRPLYVAAGAAAVLAGGFLMGIPRRIRTPGPRLVFRRRYRLYYLLSFLEGWRKQISICFAGYLLVKVHHAPLELMLPLWMAVQAAGYYASPPVGRLIDRVGERKVLLFYYASLMAFFVAYAFVGSLYVLCAVFIIDNAFFVFGMSLTTYVGRLAPKSELTPTLSMGVAMNHVAAVCMPFVGALTWGFDYRWVFLTGVVAAALSIIASLRVPTHHVTAVTSDK